TSLHPFPLCCFHLYSCHSFCKWDEVKTIYTGTIMEFYASGQPAVMDAMEASDTTVLDTDSEVSVHCSIRIRSLSLPSPTVCRDDQRTAGNENSSERPGRWR